MRFLYFLPGWEGSAGDAHVLRDVVTREEGALMVPKGNYYLCDNGYANSEGFLTPYKGVRYHLKEWRIDTQRPQNAQELFNSRHTKARNVIERAFAVLKMRWGILRSASFYSMIRLLIMACFLLHNFIRGEMMNDPIEKQLDGGHNNFIVDEDHDEVEYVDQIDPTTEWIAMRDDLENSMWIHSSALPKSMALNTKSRDINYYKVLKLLNWI
ncbi:uncharacterized protein LOC125209330 [Salvia hispanica]|uniref:uncharacterized protein LOC125209330 n=1 Tax=Salvia hispanica TaxID=49212 RepID=UPI0020092EB4|nr:uncharacterized protein LOC125209330 [Salvia hispanica]